MPVQKGSHTYKNGKTKHGWVIGSGKSGVFASKSLAERAYRAYLAKKYDNKRKKKKHKKHK